MSEWQPIETAPKDGTRVDLWVYREVGIGYRETDAKWIDGEWVRGWRGVAYPIEGMVDNATGIPNIRATHWMPLPKPPTPAEPPQSPA